MSVQYIGVQWNRHKIVYDLVLIGFIALYIATFFVVTITSTPADQRISTPIVLGRALGTCAVVLLHVILCIGPLCRISPKFLPLLYNRRHLGVATFTLMFGHAFVLTALYHSVGLIKPFVTILTTNPNYDSLSAFPFEVFGLLALIIFFLMAATSHDFWLSVLSPAVWKSLHMMVYVAYALIVAHIALGALQSEHAPIYTGLLGLGAVTVIGLHLWAGFKETRHDNQPSESAAESPSASEEWLDVAAAAAIPMNRANVISIAGRGRVAIFRHAGGLSAVSNRCAHQGGPLGEGRVLDGCITCPWHGWQYRPDDGCSPPPFEEKIPTYRIKIERGRVLIDPRPLAPGTAVSPATDDPVDEQTDDQTAAESTRGAE